MSCPKRFLIFQCNCQNKRFVKLSDVDNSPIKIPCALHKESKYHKQKHWRRSPSPGIFFAKPAFLSPGGFATAHKNPRGSFPLAAHSWPDLLDFPHTQNRKMVITTKDVLPKFYRLQALLKQTLSHSNMHLLDRSSSVQSDQFSYKCPYLQHMMASKALTWQAFGPRPQADHWSKLQAVVVQSPAIFHATKNKGCNSSLSQTRKRGNSCSTGVHSSGDSCRKWMEDCAELQN